jgi:uncharacterized LabA/DUF88 family protein
MIQDVSEPASLPFEKVMIFIDGSNLFHRLRLLRIRIDYGELRDCLVAGRNLIQELYFCSLPPDPKQNQLDFLAKLRSKGFEVRAFPLRRRGEVLVEKGVDIALATEVLVQAFQRNFDVGILVTGDEDFKGVVGETKRLGRKIEIAAFQNSASRDFQLCGNRFIPLDNLVERMRIE